MPADITAATKVKKVTVEYGDGYGIETAYAISFETDEPDETPTSRSFYLEYDILNGVAGGGANAAENLAVLQAIYASADGFQNAAGADVAPTIRGYDFATSYAEYVDLGNLDILRTGELARLKERFRIERDNLRLVVRAKDSEGLVTHTEQFGTVKALSSPDGETQTFHMGEFISDRLPDNVPAFWLNWTREDGVTSENAVSRIEAKAMWKLLEDHRHSGAAVPADGPDTSADDYDTADPLPNRVFSFTPAGGTEQRFTLSRWGAVVYTSALYPGESWIGEIYFGIAVTMGEYDAEAYTRWIQSQVVTVGAVENSLKPPDGNLQLEQKMREAIFPNGLKLLALNGIIHHEQPDGTQLPIITGKEVPHTVLPIRTGGGHSLLPDRDVSLIRVTGTVASSLHWPSAIVAGNLARPGQPRELLVYNDSSALCTFFDTSGNRRLVLRPNQWAEWLVTRSAAGAIRVLLKQVSDRRRHTMAGGNVGNVAQGRHTSFDAGTWFRPMFCPAAAAFNDVDGFTAGPAGFSYSEGVGFGTVTDWFVRGALRAEQAGELVFYQAVELKVNTGQTGTFPTGSEARLLRQVGSAAPTLLGTPNTYPELSGARDVLTLTWLYVGPINEDDVLTPGLRYGKFGGLNPGEVSIVGFTRVALIRPHVSLEYAAA